MSTVETALEYELYENKASYHCRALRTKYWMCHAAIPVPGPVLNISHISIHIFLIVLWNGWYYSLIYGWGNWGTERLNDQGYAKRRAGIWTPTFSCHRVIFMEWIWWNGLAHTKHVEIFIHKVSTQQILVSSVCFLLPLYLGGQRVYKKKCIVSASEIWHIVEEI